MARFPVSFGKRKPAVTKEDGEVVPSFRVLERTDVEGVKTFDGSSRPARPTSTVRPYSQVDNLAEEENMFTGLKVNRYVDSIARCFILIRSEASESVRGSVPRDILHCMALPTVRRSISELAAFGLGFPWDRGVLPVDPLDSMTLAAAVR